MVKSCCIENNKPLCPCCKSRDLKVIDVDMAVVDSDKHFEFLVRCKDCSNKSYYFLDLDMLIRKEVDKSSERFVKVSNEEFELSNIE